MDDAQNPYENQTSFLAFVMSLATTAAVHFGDIEDPNVGKTERNLPAARQMIELLGMLQDKTKGNLDPEEHQFLDQVLYELRMRFVSLAQDAGGVAGGAPPQSESRIVTPGGDEPRIIVPGQNEPRIIVP